LCFVLPLPKLSFAVKIFSVANNLDAIERSNENGKNNQSVADNNN
jgi:hypothetical protein